MSQQPERSLEDIILDIVFKKFPDKEKDEDTHSIEFIKEFLQKADNIDFFLENIKIVYSEGDYPHYNLSSIFSIIAEILNKGEEPLKSKLFDFTLNLLDSSKENLTILGFEIFSENRKLFWDKRKELYSKILPYWDSTSEKLKAEAIYSLESYVYVDFKYFSSYFNRLKEILIETENDLVIIGSTLILGLIYLYNRRESEVQSLDIEEVNQIFAKFKCLKTIPQKEFFLNGLHLLLLEYDKYESSWIELFFNEYSNIEELFYRSRLLNNIVTLPNKKEFSEEDSKKYFTFFHELLEVLLKQDFEKPPPSVVVRPNHLQDILHNTEQLTFYLPEVVEKLLPLYEEVYSKYVPEQVNSGLSFERLAHQWIQEIYIILSDYYKGKRIYSKSSIYYKKVADYAFNEKQRFEFLIKHYQNDIGYEIKDHNFAFIKKIFNELNELFERYKELFNETHICYSNWLVFEDLIQICDCSEVEYQKNYRTLKEHLLNNKDKISEEISSILNEIGIIKGKEFELKISKNYSECDELRIHIFKNINKILEQILEIKSPLVKEIIENITKSQEIRIRDVSQKRAIQIIDKDRKKKGFPEIKDENIRLWEDVINFLDTLNIEELFPNELPHEDDINEKICELLNQQFPNVVHKKLISGKIHIDLSIDSKIIIETKKLPSETYREFLISQVLEDLRITGAHYGIAFGIDISANKGLLRYNRLSYVPDKFISQVIKPYTLKRKSKKGKCVLCLEIKKVKDITSMVIFWSKKGIPHFNANVCEECFNKLIEYKGLWSKDGINGLKLINS